MSWTPPQRPEWVRAINAGEIAPIAEEAALPLECDALIAEALARQGQVASNAVARSEAFGRPGFEAEPAIGNLALFLAAAREEADLSVIGRWLTRRFLLRLLEVRFQLMRYLDEDPGVEEERIDAPLFVAGAPRTGTTILHTLLGADPQHRVPEGWELLRPVPPSLPPPAAHDESSDPFHDDPRIALADRELVRPQTVVSGLLSIHEYGGRKPKECLSAMSFAFQSEEFTARYSVPSYQAWLEGSDMTGAYRMHRLVLQIRQRRWPGTAWVLKSPVHLHALPTLFEIYPDARVAITHRDPLTLLASLTSLIANLRWAHSDSVDPERIAAAHLQRYRDTFDRLVDWTEAGRIPGDRVHHGHFADFQDAPIETVSRLYERFGIALTDATRERMRATLEKNAADRHGGHLYARDSSGPQREALRTAFARYQRAFSVPSDA